MRSAFISDMKSSKSNGNFRALVCVCKNVNIMRQNMKIYQLFHQHFRPFNILVCAEFDLNFIPLHSKLIQKICITNHENFHGKMENVWVKSSRLRSFEIKYLGKEIRKWFEGGKFNIMLNNNDIHQEKALISLITKQIINHWFSLEFFLFKLTIPSYGMLYSSNWDA